MRNENNAGPLQAQIRLLSFRITRDEMLAFGDKHLCLGLFMTWVAGIGRYWDSPRAGLLQYAGFGSVIYVFTLAAFIWLLLYPFKIKDWSYRHVLTFITLTSLPAVLYAIPVERFYSMDTSALINAWFLAAVALWRVALLFFYLRRFAMLSAGAAVVGTFLPIIIVIVALTMLNLEKAVFEIMGGIRERTSSDTAYAILVLLSALSVWLSVPLLTGYIAIIWKRRRAVRNPSA